MLNIRKTSNQFFWMDNIIYLISFLILYTIFKKPQKIKILYAFFCIIGISVLFTLDGNFGLKLEGKNNDKILRIDPVKLKDNCFREIYRYIDDTCYYNNIWRISALSSLVITLFILPFVKDDNVKYMPYMIICLLCIIYQSLNWKLTHSYFFVFKSVKDACKHLENNRTTLYKPVYHMGIKQ